MGVYDENITRSTTSDYPPFIDEFSVHQLIADGSGGWIATVNVDGGNFYADANLRLAIRQMTSSGTYEYLLSDIVNITTLPSLSADLVDITPNISSLSVKDKSDNYQPLYFNISAAQLSSGSSNYYDISNMSVLTDSVMIWGSDEEVELFSLEMIDEMNWKVTPKVAIEDTINLDPISANVRFMVMDALTDATVTIMASSTYHPNSVSSEEPIEWTLDMVKRYDEINLSLSSYLATLGITQSMLDSNSNVELTSSSVSFTKAGGDLVDEYCDYEVVYNGDLPTVFNIKFYNDLTDIVDYKIYMTFEYGEPQGDTYINADITIDVKVTEVTEE